LGRNVAAVPNTKLISQTVSYHKPKLRFTAGKLDPAQRL
jgi:hypothetical protein